jgi:hypothetical protein
VAELVDALDLGSSVFGRGGSSPPLRTLGSFSNRRAKSGPAGAPLSEQVFSECAMPGNRRRVVNQSIRGESDQIVGTNYGFYAAQSDSMEQSAR